MVTPCRKSVCKSCHSVFGYGIIDLDNATALCSKCGADRKSSDTPFTMLSEPEKKRLVVRIRNKLFQLHQSERVPSLPKGLRVTWGRARAAFQHELNQCTTERQYLLMREAELAFAACLARDSRAGKGDKSRKGGKKTTVEKQLDLLALGEWADVWDNFVCVSRRRDKSRKARRLSGKKTAEKIAVVFETIKMPGKADLVRALYNDVIPPENSPARAKQSAFKTTLLRTKRLEKYAANITNGCMTKVSRAELSFGIAKNCTKQLISKNPRRAYGTGVALIPHHELVDTVKAVIRRAREAKCVAPLAECALEDTHHVLAELDGPPVVARLPNTWLPRDHPLSASDIELAHKKMRTNAKMLSIPELHAACKKVRYGSAAGWNGVPPWLLAQSILDSPGDRLGKLLIVEANKFSRALLPTSIASYFATALAIGLNKSAPGADEYADIRPLAIASAW